jgi:arylsulfatase A-like enzyme
VPFIVAWPGGGVPAGAVSRASFGLVDLYSSFAALLGHGLGLDAAEDSANVLPALTGQVRGAEFQRSHAMVFHDDWASDDDLPDDALLSIREDPYVMQLDGQLVNYERLSGADRGRAVPIKLFDLDADLHQDEDLLGWPEHEVDALNAARIAGQSDDEIRDFVTRLEAARKSAG